MLQDVLPPAACCGWQADTFPRAHAYTINGCKWSNLWAHCVHRKENTKFSHGLLNYSMVGWFSDLFLFVCWWKTRFCFLPQSLIWWKNLKVSLWSKLTIENQIDSEFTIISFNCEIVYDAIKLSRKIQTQDLKNLFNKFRPNLIKINRTHSNTIHV